MVSKLHRSGWVSRSTPNDEVTKPAVPNGLADTAAFQANHHLSGNLKSCIDDLTLALACTVGADTNTEFFACACNPPA